MKAFIKENWFRVAIVVIALSGLTLWSNRTPSITHLDPPLLKAEDVTIGKQTTLSGIAYPNTRIAIYLNDSLTGEVSASSDGTFQRQINFDKEGENKLKAKQLYKNISSDFSDEILFLVDLTPPDANLFKINNKPSASPDQKVFLIKGTAIPNEYVVLNNSKHPINEDGSFEIDYPLKEGNNIVKITLSDRFDNRTEILYEKTVFVDTTPPKISTILCDSSFFSKVTTEETEEYVCIESGEWQSSLFTAVNIPITGKIRGDIKSITLDGKRIYWDENNTIYQKIPLSVDLGLNKYKIVAEDKFGNTSSDWLEITAESVTKNSPTNNSSSNTTGCCKICTTGKACGDSCISRSYTCHKGPGCACDAY